MKKQILLYVKKIGTESDVAVMLQHRWREKDGRKRGHVRGSGALGRGSLEKRDVFAVYSEGAGGVGGGDGTVVNEIVL